MRSSAGLGVTIRRRGKMVPVSNTWNHFAAVVKREMGNRPGGASRRASLARLVAAVSAAHMAAAHGCASGTTWARRCA